MRESECVREKEDEEMRRSEEDISKNLTGGLCVDVELVCDVETEKKKKGIH